MMEIGFIGLGQMGAPMAMRLLGPDVRLHVYDVNPAVCDAFARAGAVVHGSAHAVADQANLVFASLPGQSASEATAFGPQGVREGTAIRHYVEMSTIGQACMRKIAAQLADRGIATVDAPVSGGPPAAHEGRLAMLASGDPAALEVVTPWLARIGRKVHVFGDEPGQAQVMKLINNLIMATNLVAASEGLAMGVKAGLNPQAMAEMLSAGTAQSTVLDRLLIPCALSGRFDFGAHLSIVRKDVELGLCAAAELAVSMPAIEASGQTWRDASAQGYDREDFTRIFEWVMSRAGQSIPKV